MYETALLILQKIKKIGYEGYIVGGYPRDQYRGYQNPDIDICTSMPFSLLEKTFVVIDKHEKYGALTIQENGFSYEVTVYRRDFYNKDRYPEIEFVSTLKEDLDRRDFIINTLCIDCNGKYVDYMGAREDIDAKIVRCVGDPDIKLKEDPLRMIRAIRFAIDFDFSLDQSLYDAIVRHKDLLKGLSATRIQKEMQKIQNHDKLNSYIEMLDLKQYLS